MNKVRSDALWNELTPEQRQTLAAWLLDDRLSYEAALKRAQQEFGFKGSVSSVRRFCRRAALERVMEGFEETAGQTEAIESAAAEVDKMRNAGLKVMAHLFLRQVVAAPEKITEWGGLAKLILRQQEMEIRLRQKEVQNALRRDTLNFNRMRWEHNMVAQAIPYLEEILDYKKSQRDPNCTDYDENRKLNAIRRKIFGPVIPDPAPESAAEEEAIKKARGE